MPFLRYSRDKRGYENTYVLHTFRGKRGPEPRLLYWFRTPPGARVGRDPLDEEAMRAIEASNPGLDFDWDEMRKVKPAPRPPENRRRKPRPARKKPPVAPPAGQDAQPDAPAVSAAEEVEVSATLPEEVSAPAGANEAGFPSAAPEDDDDSRRDEPWEHPVVALMGEEMLARLKALYAELQAAIAGREVAAGTRDAALARAEGINPDGWETMEDAVHGIEQFETEAEAITAMLDAPPAGSGRRGGEDESQPGGAAPAHDDSQ